MSTLTIDALDVRYGGVDAVRGVSFEVAPGEIVGLIGANGAGKSSTLHAIMGVAPITGGDISLDGVSLRGRRPEEIARSGVALVPEGRRIFAELTVEENLRLGLAARALGLSKRQANEAAELGCMRVDGIQISVSCLETDVQKDAVIIAKLNVPVDPASLRQLLEINLVEAIALQSTIAIDCNGDAILMALLPVFTSAPSTLANHISQMALFANTLEIQITTRL